ncbi:MAG: OmpA family protein [Saprospiraceae bacterium]|nr:OmpA family protein [Saprospiraceae bacterium]
MKKWMLLLGMACLWAVNTDAQILPKVKRSATNKTANEVSKKVNKGIDGLFNGKKKKKKKKDQEKAAEQTGPGTQTKSGASTTNTPTTDPTTASEGAGNTPKQGQYQGNKSDFISGERVIFWDTLANEWTGEFPSRWDLVFGTVENGRFNDGNVIAFINNNSKIMPLMRSKAYLPDPFTVEADVYFHGKGNEAYYINLDQAISVRFSNASVKANGSTTYLSDRKGIVGWRKIALSYHRGALKVYLDGERLVNMPRIKKRPPSLSISALSHNSNGGKPAMIRNIKIAEGGVPLYRRLVTDGKVIFNTIQFDYNKASLRPSARASIDRIAAMMKEQANVRLSVEGHTDSDGTNEANQGLSERRAAAVKSALVEQGIAADRLQSKGWGEEKPLETDDSPEAKQQNRRVEFILISQ